jgi:endonuclease-3
MAKLSKPLTLGQRAESINAKLKALYPDAACALKFETPLQLMIATILSAQCTDVRVNMVTPALFARYQSASDFATCNLDELEQFIKSTGFFRNKAKNIRSCCQAIVEHHGGKVPNTLVDLVALPGIGRKTANVILGNAFQTPGITVDTHVGRLSRRFGLTKLHDPVKVEFALMELVPQTEWTNFSHELILHGRNVCFARNPKCDSCALSGECPKIGLKKKVMDEAKMKKEDSPRKTAPVRRKKAKP